MIDYKVDTIHLKGDFMMVKLFFYDNSEILLKQDDILYGSSSSGATINKLAINECPTSDVVSDVTHFLKNSPSFTVKSKANRTHLSSKVVKVSIR